MLQNAYFLAKIGADPAENEQHFAEILPTDFAFRLYVAVLVSERTLSHYLALPSQPVRRLSLQTLNFLQDAVI